MATPFPWVQLGVEPPPPPAQAERPAASSTATAAPAARHAPAPSDTPADPSRLTEIERDAFVKGYAQGERAGAEAGSRRGEAMLRRLGDTIEELAAFRKQLLQQSERQLVQLALALAKRIVRREMAVDEELFTALAHVAVDRLVDSGQVTIRLNPEDFGRTAAAQTDRWAAAHVNVVADAAVARGGCLVESPFGFIDANIEAQFQELARALLDGETAGLEHEAHV
jgi:flagellar assembly protein FliH